jgi:hypothetical protein
MQVMVEESQPRPLYLPLPLPLMRPYPGMEATPPSLTLPSPAFNIPARENRSP